MSSFFFRTVRGDFPVHLHPTSVLYSGGAKLPSWLIFAEMTHTGGNAHIKEVTSIDPSWLQILAPHYYEKVTLR